MKRLLLTLCALAVATSLAGCGKPFQVYTPPGFIELQDQAPTYAYRATTPEGVVVGIQVIDLEGDNSGNLEFWTRALTLQMRDVSGYALLETRDVKSRDGTPGKQLRFGHDEDSKPFMYRLSVYLKEKHLFLFESGGAKGNFDRYEKNVEWIGDNLRFK
jgi:predicted small lipoprotein YifL